MSAVDVLQRGERDPRLDRFFQAGTVEERQEAIGKLLAEHAYWRIDKILSSRFKQSGLPYHLFEDVRGEVILRLIRRLWQAAEHIDNTGIESFPDYVAVVSFNAFDDLMRRCFPARARFKNRVRYLFLHDARLATWEESHQFVAGLKPWKGSRSFLPALPEDLPPPESSDDLAEAIVSILRRVGRPVLLDALVSHLGIAFVPAEPVTNDEIHATTAPDARARPAEVHESADFLRKLWREIVDLPVRQRMALLLQARAADGESVTPLLVSAGIATFHEIAAALEIPAQQLDRLWPELPLDDLRIASLLQLRRQQVITLRRSARDRLERRMRDRPYGRGRTS